MSIKQILFRLDGRLRRRDWWLFSILLGLVQLCASFVIYTIAYPGTGLLTPATRPEPLAATVVGVILLWPNLVLAVKRQHDRDKAAWLPVFLQIALTLSVSLPSMLGPAWIWTSLLVMPFNLVGVVYVIIALGCLPGTEGENRYGPSPIPFPQPAT